MDTGSNAVLNFALVQKQCSKEVTAGENRGRQLQHTNIVHDFKTIVPVSGDQAVELHIPEELGREGCLVVIYLQDKKTYQVLDVVSLSIESE